MILSNEILVSAHKIWLICLLNLLLLASQCNAPPTPPLPTTPPGPVIQVALLTPVEGELATFGRMMRNGIIMAIEEWNSQGGVLGNRVEWIIYETRCEFETAAQTTRQVIEDGVDFIIGPLCSQAAIAVAEEAEEAQILMISPTATHPLVTVDSQGHTRPTVFRASHAYPAQGQAAARFATDTLKASQAALFTNHSDNYARALADAFAQQFGQQGGQIVYRANYSPGDLDFIEQLMAIRNSGAEIVYLPAPTQIVNLVAGQLKELKTVNTGPLSGPVLLGSDSWDSPALDLTVTDGSFFTTHFIETELDPKTQAWAETYQSNYAIQAETLAVLGYDAGLLLLSAIRQAGTVDPAIVAQSLEAGTFQGLTGNISFDQQHNPIKPVPIVAIKDGQMRSVGGVPH